jgi:hypothetical protein
MEEVTELPSDLDGSLEGKGIKLDIQIGPQPEFFVGKEDNALDRAIQLLKK